MKLVVLGKGGSGKSALVNSLLGFGRSAPGAAEESNAGYSVSTEVRHYNNRRDDIHVEVWDTPSLHENSARKTLSQLSDRTKGNADVVLFCIALSRGMRVDDSYYKLISILTEVYTERLWNHAIFVLTFANDLPYKEERQRDQHERTVKNVQEELQLAMQRAGVDSSIADCVPLLTAGYNEGVLKHETDDWNKRLFERCRERLNTNPEDPLLKQKKPPPLVPGFIRKYFILTILGVGGSTSVLLFVLHGHFMSVIVASAALSLACVSVGTPVGMAASIGSLWIPLVTMCGGWKALVVTLVFGMLGSIIGVRTIKSSSGVAIAATLGGIIGGLVYLYRFL